MNSSWIHNPCKGINGKALKDALDRQAQLTKPPGSLGRLEEIATRLAGLQGTYKPQLDTVRIVIFAADHGVAAEHVSAFPQSVTVEMLRNFAGGGAAVNVLAKHLQAELEVINVGTVTEVEVLPGVIDQRIGPGSANFCADQAMTETQLEEALEIGRDAVARAVLANTNLFIGGEMGIANTTSASALACVLLSCAPDQIVGPGTGLDRQGIQRKTKVIEKALEFHRDQLGDTKDVLRTLGGYEIAALVGSYIAAAQQGIAVLVDGFISSVAALVSIRMNPSIKDWLFFSHMSAEPAHALVLASLDEQPLLTLGMRLGEGSGSAVAVPVMRLACALHNEMATFSEAAVSTKA